MDPKEKDSRTHAIIGAAMEVDREMGPGFLEAVYHECLEIEFQIRKIPYISKPRLKLYLNESGFPHWGFENTRIPLGFRPV